MKVLSYLYNESGDYENVDLSKNTIQNLSDRQLLWINIPARDKKLINQTIASLQLSDVPVNHIIRTRKRPKIFKFRDFYYFFIVSAEIGENKKIRPVPIDCLVGENFVITIYDEEVSYLREFTDREEGETPIGELDAESFVATMLDLHIASYFRILEKIEKEVDEVDKEILQKDLDDDEFLKRMVKLRGEVSTLRRWFLPHRDVFYALSRPDFLQNTNSESFENFKMLDEHFESAADSIESSRETVLSLFDLYTTKTSHRMNNLMKRLTFITLMVGLMGVIAGVLGMNFEEDFFKSPTAFWFVIAGMLFITIGTTFFAWMKRWF